jgi:hypothetical protein
MKSFVLLVLAASLAIAATTPALAQETILKNDGFVDGQAVGFQGGFITGEIGASRLVPTGTGPWTVNRVQLLFGGAVGIQTITLHIWADGAGTTNPGTELFLGDYQLVASNEALQEIDLILEEIQVTGPFRVGIEFQHDGLPSIARDGDGTINASRNFIFAAGFGWVQSSLFGLTGDWIIRAGVTPVTTGVPGQGAASLALAIAGANPSRDGRVTLSVTLPNASPARVDLVDVTGRVVASRDIGSLGAGRHTIDLSSAQRLPSGVYVAHLTQGIEKRAVRLVVTR